MQVKAVIHYIKRRQEGTVDPKASQQFVTNEHEQSTLGVAEILRIFSRRKFLILAVILVTVAGTALYTARLRQRFEAVCKVDIDLNTPRGGVTGDTISGIGAQSEQKMTTQLAIISSQSMTWDVIKALKLYTNPEFVRKVDPGRDPDTIPATDKLLLIQQVQSGLTVQFERGTEVADIKYRSTDPKMAVLIANAIASAYIQRNVHTRYATTKSASDWIEEQLFSLRMRADRADQDFTAFQRKTGILQTDDVHSVELDKMAQLNSALSAAETLRIGKEISFHESVTTDPDLVLPPASVSALLALRSQEATLQAQYASMSPRYGDAYPRMLQLKSQIEQVQASIASQIFRGREQLKGDFNAAQQNENSLRAAVEDQRRTILGMNEDMLHFMLLKRQLAASRNLYEGLTQRLQEAQITSGLSVDSIAIIDPALQPYVPAEPRRTFNMEVGIFLGIILGLASALFADAFNATIQSFDDIKLYTGLNVLGLVPHVDLQKVTEDNKRKRGDQGALLGPQLVTDSQSPFAESFRNLRSSVLLSSPGSPPQVILIASAWPKEGKSTCSINLAVTLAQTGARVLLVDADLKRPTLHLKLGTGPSDQGLSLLLTSSERRTTKTYVKAGALTTTLDFLPAGKIPPASAELLLSGRMSELLQEWREDYDFIVLDTAPVLAVSDATALIRLADATILVARAGATRRQSLRALRDAVVSVRGTLAGVLLNDVKADSEAYYNYYGGYRSYGGYDKRTDVYGEK